MNDQQIYELMAKTPDIRAVQICDALDAPLTEVSAALRALVDVGDVVKHSDFGDNGRQVQVYNLSEDFKKSRDGKALLARTVPAEAAAPGSIPPVEVAAAAPAPISQPPAGSAAVTGPIVAPTSGRKPDRAIAYLSEHGTATDDQLRAVMGIRKQYAPAAYLVAAMRAGKLHKANGVWKLGKAPVIEYQVAKDDVTVTEAASAAGPVERLKNAIANFAANPEASACQEPSSATQIPTLSAVVETHIPANAEAPAARYRCALWSDGLLEVRRDGETVAEMPQAAGESLVAFLSRLTQPKEAA